MLIMLMMNFCSTHCSDFDDVLVDNTDDELSAINVVDDKLLLMFMIN